MFYYTVLQGFIFIFIVHISFSKPNLTVYVRLITLSPQSENSNLSRKDILKIEIVHAFVTKIPYTFATKPQTKFWSWVWWLQRKQKKLTLFVNGVVHLCELQQTLNSHSNCNQLRNNGFASYKRW